MQNRVGTVVPTDEEIAQLERDIRSVSERILRWGITLNTDERQSTAKLRLGGEAVVELVLRLADEQKLNIKGIPLDGMKADLEVFKKSRKLEQLLTETSQVASDTRLLSQSELWQACMAYYSTLLVMASRDAALATAMQPAVDFMSTKRGKTPTPPA